MLINESESKPESLTVTLFKEIYHNLVRRLDKQQYCVSKHNIL